MQDTRKSLNHNSRNNLDGFGRLVGHCLVGLQEALDSLRPANKDKPLVRLVD